MKKPVLFRQLILAILLIYVIIYKDYFLKYVEYQYTPSNRDNIIIEQSLVINDSRLIYNSAYDLWSRQALLKENLWNYKNYSQKRIESLTVMGKRLFLHENIGDMSKKRQLIYVYKFGKRIAGRLINNYGPVELDPFDTCSVSCNISYDETDSDRADAVLFHLHLLRNNSFELTRRKPEQIWVWMSDESPFNTLMMAKNKDLSQFDGMFNWSMTYRSSSDVPVPYGRTLPIVGGERPPPADMFKKNKKLIAAMGSNCSGRNGRWKYIRELLKHIQVDAYGGCGNGMMPKCPGHFRTDCPLIEGYKFYLSFENANCLEYLTEKVWWNAIAKGAIPVVMGSSKQDYVELLPPNSFIYVDDFKSPIDLAEYLRTLSTNETAFNTYHQWRSKFRVVNEHGYFQTRNFHYCRLCEALHYNDRSPKVYESMKAYWDKDRDCYPSLWSDKN